MGFSASRTLQGEVSRLYLPVYTIAGKITSYPQGHRHNKSAPKSLSQTFGGISSPCGDVHSTLKSELIQFIGNSGIQALQKARLQNA